MLQSEKASELYLNYAREAVMNRGLNIARTEVILLLAKTLANDTSMSFDYTRFEEDWKKGAGCDAFIEDLKKTRSQGIERFPTLTMSAHGKKSTAVVGYKSYSVMLDTFEKLLAVMQPT
jgi:predicted DsbA family dithiol-disulfide isomerase